MFRSIGLDSQTLSLAIAVMIEVRIRNRIVSLLWSGTGSRVYSSSCPWLAITNKESEALGLRGKPAWTPCITLARDGAKVTASRMGTSSGTEFLLPGPGFLVLVRVELVTWEVRVTMYGCLSWAIGWIKVGEG